MFAAVVAYNVLSVLALAAVAAGWVPASWYEGLMAGLHASIGITVPNRRQVRWVVIAWIASMLLIVDAMVLLVVYVL